MDMNRTEKIEVKLTPKEKQKLREVADNHGLKMSQYIRIQAIPTTEVKA